MAADRTFDDGLLGQPALTKLESEIGETWKSHTVNRLSSVGGTSTAYTAQASPALTGATLAAGLVVSWVPNAANGGAATLNIDSLGAKALKKGDGSAYAAGELPAGRLVMHQYDGTNFVQLGEEERATSDTVSSETANSVVTPAVLQSELNERSPVPFTDSDYVAPIVDGDGNVLGGVTHEGELDLPLKDPDPLPFTDSDYREATVDSAGNVIGGIRHDGLDDRPRRHEFAAYIRSGRAYASSEATGEIQVTFPYQGTAIWAEASGRHVEVLLDTTPQTWLRETLPDMSGAFDAAVTEVWGIPSLGQSLSIGYTGSNPTAYTTEPLDAGFAKMFNVGLRTLGHNHTIDAVAERIPEANIATLVDLIENVPDYDPYNNGQKSGEVGAAHFAHRLLGGLTPAGTGIIASAHGIGSATYAIIDPDTGDASTDPDSVIVANLLRAVRRGRLLAAIGGRTYKVPVVELVHGEANKNDSQATYLGHMQELQAYLDTKIKEITGQSEEVILLTDQMVHTGFTVPLAQLQAAKDAPDQFICAMPKYFLPYMADKLHLTSLGYQWAGVYRGRAAHRKLVSGVDPLPLHMVSAVRTGDTIVVTFGGDVTVPIVSDTSLFTDPGAKGFYFSQTGGNSVTITDASITDDLEVTLTLSDIPTGTAQKVGVGVGTTGEAGATGKRSTIHDSESETVELGDGNTYALYNWAAIDLIDVTT